MASIQPLFGLPSHPWPTFRPVNDTVRGGSSTSSFTPSSATNTAIFQGHLDTKTLGGAGFASQCSTFHPRLSFPSPPSRGILLTIVRPASFATSEPTSFVLNLKNDKPGLRGDGRRESAMSYEFQFDLRDLGDGEGVVEIEAEWKDFEASYRGRPDKEAKPLDTESIYELSFMCRSNFAKQEGDFKLEIVSLGIMGAPEKSAKGTRGCFAGISSWWRGEGAVRLPK